MMRSLLLLVLSIVAAVANANGFDDLQQALEQNAQVQEKVYLHTDNTCYFVGDTLWYKAYVLRADNLQPTDMSRLLYVELLSPDGLVVERQRIIDIIAQIRFNDNGNRIRGRLSQNGFSRKGERSH